MGQSSQAHQQDRALAHHLIRVFGHRPTPADLERYERAQARAGTSLAGRARRGAARLLMRLAPTSER